jgi:hypothetical protein
VNGTSSTQISERFHIWTEYICFVFFAPSHNLFPSLVDKYKKIFLFIWSYGFFNKLCQHLYNLRRYGECGVTLKLNSVNNNETIGQERIFTHFEDSHWYSQKRQHRWVFLWLWNVIQQCDDYVLLCKQLISLTKTALSALSKCTNKKQIQCSLHVT